MLTRDREKSRSAVFKGPGPLKEIKMKFNIFNYLSGKNKLFVIAAGLLLTIAIGVIDFLISNKVSFSIFYVFPVIFVTWYLGFVIGTVFSFFSACLWFFDEYLSRSDCSIPVLILLWNSLVRFSFFIIISYILYQFKKEKEFARLDHLTNIPNRFCFHESMNRELSRSERYGHPLTLVYMDVDNFKTINDTFGHETGDSLLITVSNTIMKNLRLTDSVSRLGGDEFAILLIETDEKEAPVILKKLKNELMYAMNKEGWPVSFSFGAVTFNQFNLKANEMLKIVDQSMYEAKNAGKNKIIYKTVN